MLEAYKLGTRAVGQGVEVQEIASVHHLALIEVLFAGEPEDRKQEALRAIESFCSACPAWVGGSAKGHLPVSAAWSILSRSLSAAADDQRSLRRAKATLLRVDEAREEEARRIAHALHDDAAQLVATAHMALDEMALENSIPEAQLDRVRARLDEIAEHLRSLSHELRPTVLDDFGLTAALETLAGGVSHRSGVRITIESALDGRLPQTIETTLYRVVQECLRNVVKHAAAGAAAVTLTREGEGVACSVRDDGTGFGAHEVLSGGAPRGLGLVGMRERVTAAGGKFHVSTSAAGTEVFVWLPVPAAALNAGGATAVFMTS